MLKTIPRYQNYLINESGVIINNNTDSIVRTAINNDGLLYTTLDGNIEFISNLVFETFGNKEINDKNVIHKDNDPLNNHITNLKLSNKDDKLELVSRDHKHFARALYVYEVYNSDESEVIECNGRGEVAKLIQYEEISLKNMVGNRRVISLGPYSGYQIRRTDRKVENKDDERN